MSKTEGVRLAKEGGIAGVAVAARNGMNTSVPSPDGQERNNLGEFALCQRLRAAQNVLTGT